MRPGNLEKVVLHDRYKWRIDGKCDWKEYQDAVVTEFADWEAQLGELNKNMEEEELVEAAWESWMDKVTTAAERGIGKKVRENSKGWWSKEIEAAIQARKEACRKVREARQRKDATLDIRWKDYKDKRKAVKKLLRREKKELRRKTLRKIREQGGASSKLFWSDLVRRKKKGKSIPRMKSKLGQIVESQEEVVEELAKHWEELGMKKESESAMEENRMESSEAQSDICEMVTTDEVVGILKQLKRGKATGPDGIPNEMMIYGGTRMVVTMVQLFNLVIQHACCPKDWRRNYIVPLYWNCSGKLRG